MLMSPIFPLDIQLTVLIQVQICLDFTYGIITLYDVPFQETSVI